MSAPMATSECGWQRTQAHRNTFATAISDGSPRKGMAQRDPKRSERSPCALLLAWQKGDVCTVTTRGGHCPPPPSASRDESNAAACDSFEAARHQDSLLPRRRPRANEERRSSDHDGSTKQRTRSCSTGTSDSIFCNRDIDAISVATTTSSSFDPDPGEAPRSPMGCDHDALLCWRTRFMDASIDAAAGSTSAASRDASDTLASLTRASASKRHAKSPVTRNRKVPSPASSATASTVGRWST